MTPPARKFLPISALLLIGVQLLGAVAVLLLGGLFTEGETVSPIFLIAATLVAPLIAIYVGLVRYAPTEPTAAALRLSMPAPAAWPSLALALLFGVACSPLLVALQAQVVALVPAEAMSPELLEELKNAVAQPGTLLVITVAQLAFAPIIDEALFRGLIQPRLEATLGARRALWVTLLFYAAAQMNPRVFPLALVVGLPLGVIALWTRTTWAPILAHLGMGLAPYVAAAADRPLVDLDSGAVFLPAWAMAACAALSAASLVALWRLRRRRQP